MDAYGCQMFVNVNIIEVTKISIVISISFEKQCSTERQFLALNPVLEMEHFTKRNANQKY